MTCLLRKEANDFYGISLFLVLRIENTTQSSKHCLLHKLSEIIDIQHRTLVVPAWEERYFRCKLRQSWEISLRIRTINHTRTKDADLEVLILQLMKPYFSLKLRVAIEAIRILLGILGQHLTLQRLTLMEDNLTRHEDKLLHSCSLCMLSNSNRQIAIHLII